MVINDLLLLYSHNVVRFCSKNSQPRLGSLTVKFKSELCVRSGGSIKLSYIRTVAYLFKKEKLIVK